jgi:acetyltransferase
METDRTSSAYPTRYVSPWQMKTGEPVIIRPIRPEDEPALARFHETLSDRSVYLRYFHMEKLSSRVAHDRLARRCSIDYDREMALVAERRNPAGAGKEIIAVGRLIQEPETRDAEVAVIVADAFQRCGLGSELLRRLTATTLPENLPMRSLMARAGFAVVNTFDLSAISMELKPEEKSGAASQQSGPRHWLL